MSEIPPPGRERDHLLYRLLCPHGTQGVGYPHYSTDDPDALLVLKAMEARGYGWTMSRPVPEEGGRPSAMFTRSISGYDSVWEEGDTLADAITEAALRALEADDAG